MNLSVLKGSISTKVLGRTRVLIHEQKSHKGTRSCLQQALTCTQSGASPSRGVQGQTWPDPQALFHSCNPLPGPFWLTSCR